ncbi:hypothetical protein BCV69DRAFT_296161 [Microstroma glucosiphilum]|uniref:t-SNARE coiled-coil homology domain-containing protein n=1 Tax=Pseudomicrostroma glucosiphilum TaxID=1684307 RepID=A0A316UF67_9BASI|nr:hypothetical protein BCV69DRAFT_296161 [Pseudomicrostroma glucosiphilum]PWN23850.1 hypothetical protein BCV69DRAFT_296161 [Pseudomicrostroma glucosiphilum]
MSTSASSTLERQNDDVLEGLLGKVKQLRGVTTDIYDDAEAQRGILDNTVSHAFSPVLLPSKSVQGLVLTGTASLNTSHNSPSAKSHLFDVFGNRLRATSNRFSHTIVQGSRHNRLTLYIVGGFVALFILYRLLF